MKIIDILALMCYNEHLKRGLSMLKLNKVVKPTNQFILQYMTCHTNANEQDIWISLVPYVLDEVSNFDDIIIFLECFKVIKEEIDKSRTGYGYPAESIDFETLAEDNGFDKIEWHQDMGVSIFKNGKEYFISVDTDLGMPTEDGHFLAGISIEVLSYFDQNGIEYTIDITPEYM